MEMTKDDSRIIDWRSTGRRKARRVLFNSYRDFACEGILDDGSICGRTSIKPPMDAPVHFSEIWPESNRTLTTSLQAQHLTKDLTQNTDDVLKWLCPSCHKKEDAQTDLGESTIDQSMWG